MEQICSTEIPDLQREMQGRKLKSHMSRQLKKAKTMNNLKTKTATEKIHPSLQNYYGIDNDVASYSEISDLTIKTATLMSVTYSKPNDGMPVNIAIWKGLVADVTTNPILQQAVTNYSGTVDVPTPSINLLKGVYTVAIISNDLRVVAATLTIMNGQNIQGGSSTLFVIAKNMTSINTIFNMPANVIGGSQTITWVILKEGGTIGKGNTISSQTTTPASSSGLVPVTFPAGTLKEGQMYNVVLNPGGSTLYVTAGYAFKYVLQ